MRVIVVAAIAFSLCCDVRIDSEVDTVFAKVNLHEEVVHGTRNRKGEVDMAIPVWISTSGNWNSTASWSTGLVPANTDSVVFDGRSSTSVIAGLDQNAVVLNQLTIKPDYLGNIGSPGDPLHIGVDSTAAGVSRNAIFKGRGIYYFRPIEGNFCDVIMDGTGTLFLQGAGTVRNLFCRGGFTQVAALVNVSARTIVLAPSARLDVLEVAVGELGPTVMVVTAGTYNNARAGATPATVFVSGGKFIQTAIMPAGVDVYVFAPGVFSYVPTSAPGTAPDLFAMAGLTDLGQTPFTLSFTDIIIGPQAGVNGTPHSGGVPSGTTVSIDLREEFP